MEYLQQFVRVEKDHETKKFEMHCPKFSAGISILYSCPA